MVWKWGKRKRAGNQLNRFQLRVNLYFVLRFVHTKTSRPSLSSRLTIFQSDLCGWLKCPVSSTGKRTRGTCYWTHPKVLNISHVEETEKRTVLSVHFDSTRLFVSSFFSLPPLCSEWSRGAGGFHWQQFNRRRWGKLQTRHSQSSAVFTHTGKKIH